MEALAPGPALRGRRRARASGSVLSALSLAAVVLSALVRAPPAVGHLARVPRGFRLTQDTLKIVGSTHFPVASIDTEKGSKPCTDHSCEASKRLSKAKNLIERFFIQQVEVLGKRAEPLPEIYYIEGTLQMVWVNRCFPGYGINILKHPKCPECCVVCSPGSFNPRDGTHCLQCNNSVVYGAKTCM